MPGAIFNADYKMMAEKGGLRSPDAKLRYPELAGMAAVSILSIDAAKVPRL